MTAVFGIDAHIAEEFHDRVCVEKASRNEGAQLNLFHTIDSEDIVFIKRYSAVGLQVVAVGVVLSGYTDEAEDKVCIPVEWVWRGEKLIEDFDEKCSRCADSLYEENNITVQRTIIDLMPDKLQLAKEW